jgi:hypothetical protein
MRPLMSDLAGAMSAHTQRRQLGVITACLIVGGLLALVRASAMAPFVYMAF